MNTLLVKKQKKYFKYQLKPFIDGLTQVKYVLLQLHPEEKDITLRTYLTLKVAVLLLFLRKKSVIVEYHPTNKWMTLNDKKIFLKQDTLIMSWLQMSVRGLIGNEKDFKPFWNERCQEISQNLWLPTETDYVGSHLNFWNGSSKQIMLNSWFSMKKMDVPKKKNSQMTSSQSFIFIPADKWKKEGIRTRKIRLYPTQEQKTTMKKWMGTRRYVYNRVLENIKKDKDTKINFFSLRNKYVISKNNPLIKEWETETPKDIRAGAVRDLVKNHTSAFSCLKNKQIKKFNMNFCSRRDTPSIEIPKSAITMSKKDKNKKKDFNGVFIYKRYIPDKIKIAKGEEIDISIECDCRLKIENDVWFLCVPIKVEAKKKINREKEDWCSIDPGVRSFNTIYSENMSLQIKVDAEKIKLLHDKIDKFKSLRDKKIIKRKRLKRRERKVYFRINNLIDELHFKTISYLTKTFNYIILPIFESQEMSRNIKTKSVNRNLLQLKHFLFRQRLQSKCMLEKTYLDVCTEEYTTKTCGGCGELKDVGFSSIYSCLKCGIVIDRDINGARNIAIKRISEMS